MTKVFIGGSRRLSRMNPELAHRFDNIIEKRLRVLVGDANGFDRAAQAYLAENGYRAVIVYCTAGVCRNNVGDWPLHAVEYHGRDRGLEFYTAKDDAMLRDADYGLFAWDGKSKGTLRNVKKMAEEGRPSSVYVSSIRKFVTVRSTVDAKLLSVDMNIEADTPEDLFSDAWQEARASDNGHRDVETNVHLSDEPRLVRTQEMLFDLACQEHDGQNGHPATATLGGKKKRKTSSRKGTSVTRKRKAK